MAALGCLLILLLGARLDFYRLFGETNAIPRYCTYKVTSWNQGPHVKQKLSDSYNANERVMENLT